MSERPRIGVVGATGAVGTVTLALLAERGYEDVRAFASGRSAGSRVPFGERELVGTVREHVHPGGLVVHGADGTTTIPHGSTLAVRLAAHEPKVQSGPEERTTRLPEGTNLVVARRSADGRSVHWLCYREHEPPSGA